MKLHIGCGKHKLEGWTNIDVSSEKDADMVVDVRDGLPFESDTVSFIYSEHFIEHLTLGEARNFAKECHRVLRPNGVVRVATIDLQFLIQKYLGEWKDQQWLKCHSQVFSRGSMINACFYWWNHRYIYDVDDMSGVFSMFTMIREEFGQSRHEALQDLEIRSESTLICDFIKLVISL